MKKHIIITLLFLGLFNHGCATVPSARISTQDILLKELCQNYNIEWQWDSVSQLVVLSRGRITVKALVGSNVVIINDKRIALSNPIRRRNGLVYVPYDFKAKVIDRLIKEPDYKIIKFERIVIDAGHGGKDPGAIGRAGLKEKEVNLDIAKRLKRNLESKGIDVYMTRKSDKFIALEERAALANRSKPDLFISIHANASYSKRVKGFEIYYLKNLGRATQKEIYRSKNYKNLFDKLAMEKNHDVLDKILLDMLYTFKRAESENLAEYISTTMDKEMSLNNRGCKTAEFSVLKNTLIPAILIEVGFLSNKTEEALLSTDSYRQKIADSITEGILNYVKGY